MTPLLLSLALLHPGPPPTETAPDAPAVEATDDAPAAALATEAPAAEAPAAEAPAAGAPTLEILRIAVYDLEVSDIEPKVQRVVKDALIVELRKLANVNVVGMSELQAMLDHESQKALMGCDEESCLADIAGALGVDALVIGSLARVGEEHVIALKRIDQREAQVTGTFQQRLEAGDGEEFLAVVGPAVEQLFGDVPVRDGLVRGASETAALRLNPPPVPPWAFWSLVATTGALSAATLGAVSANATLFWAYSLYRDQGKGDGAARIDYQTLSQLAVANNVALASSVALAGLTTTLAATAGVTALFTDFHGYGDAPSEELE